MSTAADDKVITEARKRFKRAEQWERVARDRFRSDIRFAEGDSDNRWQWDDAQYKSRTAQSKPALTVNKTREHNLQILNDQRQNKSQVRVRPVGDGATFQSAEIYEGIVRHIEYQSRALEAYDAAAYNQVYGGWGYWRITTDYADSSSFDQEIFIRRVPNPLTVYLDPDIQEFDGSDARWGFFYFDRPRDDAEGDYPWLKDTGAPKGNQVVPEDMGWNDSDHVRECEYWRKSEKADELLHLQVLGVHEIVRKSAMEEKYPDFEDGFTPDMIVRRRPVTKPVIEWFKIVGDRVVEKGIWPGAYIPLVRVVGEETVIDGRMDRKGHTRALKDPQRMYNYYSSAAVEYAAGQTKTPWLAPAAAIEGYQDKWNSANTDTLPFLPWTHADDQGVPIPKPERMTPPVSHSAAMEGMRIAQMEMMMASGQYQSQFGENENAKSGIAIQTRQRQGENSTYHYIDHLAQAIEFTGRQLIDLIPKIYDTPRIIKIMAEDGDQTEVNIDPNGPAYEQRIAGRRANEQEIKAAKAKPDLKDKVETIFNPSVGKYDVQADVGPAYATKREEAFAAMSELAKMDPQLLQVAGDLMFRMADFPLAPEIAERFKNVVPKNITGEAPPPEVVQMQQQYEQQLQFLQQSLGQAMQKLADKGSEDRDRAASREREDYKAETGRIQALTTADPEAFKLLAREIAVQLAGLPATPGAPGAAMTPVIAAQAHAEQQMAPPEPEAQEAVE